MITEATLVFIIGAFCRHTDTNIPKEDRIECVEFMADCTVMLGGQTTEQRVTNCKLNWADTEVSRKLRNKSGVVYVR